MGPAPRSPDLLLRRELRGLGRPLRGVAGGVAAGSGGAKHSAVDWRCVDSGFRGLGARHILHDVTHLLSLSAVKAILSSSYITHRVSWYLDLQKILPIGREKSQNSLESIDAPGSPGTEKN